MFIDEIYEEVLINQHGKITNAHVKACKEKLDLKNSTHQDIQRIENGYQLFRKRYPEFAEDSFRRFCYVRWSGAGQDHSYARFRFASLGWSIKPEYELIGR